MNDGMHVPMHTHGACDKIDMQGIQVQVLTTLIIAAHLKIVNNYVYLSVTLLINYGNDSHASR